MEATEQCVDFFDAADLLGVPQRVDDAGMSARADHYQPAITETKAGSMLVPMLVGLRLAGQFLGSEMVVHIGVGVTAETILNADSDPGVRQYALDAGARYRAGRK